MMGCRQTAVDRIISKEKRGKWLKKEVLVFQHTL